MIKNVSIIVPTRNRYEKLIRMIRSIPQHKEDDRAIVIGGQIIPLKLYVTCDGDAGTYKQLEDKMYDYAKNLEFEDAASIRDDIKNLQSEMIV